MAVLKEMKVAMLVADGFEQSEMVQPKRALEQAGARALIVSPEKDIVQGWIHFDPADTFPVDVALRDARAEDFDALLLPGGVANPDRLRTDAAAVNFVRHFVDAGKPIAAICHGPWMLVEADAVRGRRITSWPSLRTDLQNAGAKWVDEEVVVDRGLVSSRQPADLEAFCRRMLEEFGERRCSPAATRARA